MTNSSGSGTRRTAWVWIILGVIVVAFALIFSLIPSGSGSQSASEKDGAESSTPSAEQEEEIELPDFSRRIDGDPTALGDVDAPVVILEFADYRCPYCGVFATDTLPTLVDEYVDEGLVRVEWRDVPIFGEESFAAAVAARAAGEQDLYWEYNAAIFAGADSSGHQSLPTDKLIALAEEVGVPDIEKFTADLENPDLH